MIDHPRDAVIREARALHREAHAVAEAEREADLAKIARELKSVALEGLVRIIEVRGRWFDPRSVDRYIIHVERVPERRNVADASSEHKRETYLPVFRSSSNSTSRRQMARS